MSGANMNLKDEFGVGGALLSSKRLLDTAERAFETSEEKDGNAYWRERSERAYREAAIYAAVAQAEALTRLAEAAEALSEALSDKQLFDTWGRVNVVIDKGDW